MNTPAEIAHAGGAYVRRPFTLGAHRVANGDVLTAAQVRAIPNGNLRALINLGKIDLFPSAPEKVSRGGAEFAEKKNLPRPHKVGERVG